MLAKEMKGRFLEGILKGFGRKEEVGGIDEDDGTEVVFRLDWISWGDVLGNEGGVVFVTGDVFGRDVGLGGVCFFFFDATG